MKQIVLFILVLSMAVFLTNCGGGNGGSRSSGGGSGGGGTGGTGTGTGTGGGNGGGQPPAGIVLSFNYTWTVDGDATSAQLEAMKSNIDRLNESLFSMGHGQQYIQSVTLRDNANDGDIRTPVDRVEASTLGGGSYAYTTGSGSGGIYIVCGGLVDRVTFGHEHGHKEHFLAGNNPSMMSVGEEYNCNACVMAIGGTRQYCDSTNHSTQYSFEPCWAGVMSNHPGMNHIEGDYSAPSGSCPAAQITVNDN